MLERRCFYTFNPLMDESVGSELDLMTPEKLLQSHRLDSNRRASRFYGNNIKTMIDVANTWEAGEMKDALQYTIANHMKKSFLNWNKDTVEDGVIFGHLFELSNGKIDLRDSKEPLSEISSLLKVQRKFTSHKKTSKKNNNQRNRKRY